MNCPLRGFAQGMDALETKVPYTMRRREHRAVAKATEIGVGLITNWESGMNCDRCQFTKPKYGGTVVGFCDGSTDFVMSDIDAGNQEHPTGSAEQLATTGSHYGVWGAMGSANGAEDIKDAF